MNSHLHSLDVAVLTAYIGATLYIGVRLGRRSRTPEGFTAGGRALPGWVCGLSIFATFLSSISFLAVPGGAYGTNWNWFAFSLSLPLTTWLAVRFFLPYYRRSGEVSAYALLERRFGPWARLYASGFYLLTQVMRRGTVTYLIALSLSVLNGWKIGAVIAGVGACVTAYAFVGGLVAVVWTDALQSFVLTAGAVLALGTILFSVPGGPAEVVRLAAAHDKFSLGSFDWRNWAAPTFWVVLLHGLAINLQNFGIDQNYVQRYIASPTDREARRSVWLGGLLYVPVSAALLLIGTSLYAWHRAQPADLAEVRAAVAAQRLSALGVAPSAPDYAERMAETAAALTDRDLGDWAFPHFIDRRLPVGLAGLVMAAILAAGMSTISTSLNVSATLLMTDIYRRHIRPDATDRQCMRVLRGATIAWGAIGTRVALLMINIQSALDTWWKLASVFSGGMAGLFLLGMISRRAGRHAAAAAVALGIAVIAWMSLSQSAVWPTALAGWRCSLHPFLAVVVGTATILYTGLVFTGIGRHHERILTGDIGP